MATQNLTTADGILKDLYVGPIIEQLNYKTYMIDQIERTSEFTVDHHGRKAIVPVHAGRNLGRGSRADGGALPNAGRQRWEDALIPLTRHYQGIEITDAARRATESNAGAFTSLLDNEVKGAAKDLRKDINRQIWGPGGGVLALASGGSTTTIVVDSIQYVKVGDPIDVLVVSTGAPLHANSVGRTITAIDAGTKTITVDSSMGGTPGGTHGVYLAGTTGTGGTQEMVSLQQIVASSRTLFGLNSATPGNEFWNGQVMNVGANAGSPALAGETSFELISDKVGQTGQGETEVFITSRGVRRRLADTFQSTKRFTNRDAIQIHGGYSAIMVSSGNGEVPVVADDDAPKGQVFAIDKQALRWFSQWGPGWLEKDGGVFHLKTGSAAGSREATWQAWMGWYATLASVAPNRLGKLQFCTDDTPGVSF